MLKIPVRVSKMRTDTNGTKISGFSPEKQAETPMFSIARALILVPFRTDTCTTLARWAGGLLSTRLGCEYFDVIDNKGR